MHVVAVVVATGREALTPVAGVPMVVWSVRAVLASGVVDHVSIDAGEHTSALLRACTDLPVRAASVRIRAHAGQRAGAPGGDDPSGVVLVHDAIRPLAPPALFTDVVDAMRDGHPSVVPVLSLPDTVKLVDGAGLVRGTPDRSGLRVVQTPYAYRADARSALTIAGDPLAFPVRTAWDLELAELLVNA